MSYTAGVFFLDPIGGSDAARTALTTVTVANPSGTITRATKTAHGLVTGAVVDLTLFTAWLNEAWKITVVDANNFDLDGAVWQATADNNGTATPRGGSSKTDAWKTINSGATSARTAAGDTIRLIASTDPTLVGNATFTKGSKTVTLAGAVTADISTCGAAWTASANVTTTTSATRKEGTLSTSIAPNATFTTGLAAYEAMSSTDYSAYQQISFWIQCSIALTAGQLTLKLCSDALGASAINTINVPAYPIANVWMPCTVDTAGALHTAVQSVALYVVTDVGASGATILLDNIIAVKASASADALSLQSLVGKVWNLNWAASTTYAANDIRKPTSPNRNGFRFKVTAGGGGSSGSSEPTWPTEVGVTVTDGALTWTCDSLEETWYPIQSIRGTTVLLDNGSATLASTGRGYHGTTETVATYKREPLLLTPVSASADILGAIQRSGTVAGGQITYSGGWNRTDMTTQTGETWLSGQIASGMMYNFNGKTFVTLSNLNAANCSGGFYNGAAGSVVKLVNCQAAGCTNGLTLVAASDLVAEFAGFVAANNTTCGINTSSGVNAYSGRCVGVQSNLSHGVGLNGSSLASWGVAYVEHKNNGGYGTSSGLTSRPKFFRNVVSEANVSAAFDSTSTDFVISGDATVTDTNVTGAPTAFSNTSVYINNLNGVGAKVITDGGTIAQSTAQRNTASGYSWLFSPTNANRTTDYPLRLSLGRVPCTANTLSTLAIYVYRDSTNIKGRLMVKGAQIAGVGADAYTDCAPSINTWTQYTLTFTPTATGVVEATFEGYDGVGTTNSLWIDDASIDGVALDLDTAFLGAPVTTSSAVLINPMAGIVA